MNRFRSMATVALLSIALGTLSGCVSSGTSSGGSPKITTTTIPSTATVGLAYAGATISTSGGTPPLSYSVSTGQLPPGIVLSKTGAIAGTARAACNVHLCGAGAGLAQPATNRRFASVYHYSYKPRSTDCAMPKYASG